MWWDCSTTWCWHGSGCCLPDAASHKYSIRQTLVHKQSPEFCIEWRTATILSGCTEFTGRVSGNTIRRDSLEKTIFLRLLIKHSSAQRKVAEWLRASVEWYCPKVKNAKNLNKRECLCRQYVS